ncbi:MAG: hypothetical protein ACRDV4_03315 [Acidimicrobiales bacterium]
MTDLEDAEVDLEVGADVLVAQEAEAGGHVGARWSTLPFVPLVVDLAAPLPKPRRIAHSSAMFATDRFFRLSEVQRSRQ